MFSTEAETRRLLFFGDNMKMLITFLILCCFAGSVGAEVALSIDDIELHKGETAIVEIGAVGDFDYGQVGIKYNRSVIEMSGGECGRYGTIVTLIRDGSMHAQAYTGSHTRLVTDDHVFGSVAITAIGEVGTATPLHITDAILVGDDDSRIGYHTIDGNVIILPRMGDVNQDLVVDVRDVLVLLNHILDPETYPYIDLLTADMNSDGVLDILDVLSLINTCASQPHT